METVAKHVDDDLDLDALMIRVREAAMASGTSDGAAPPKAAGDANGAEIDLVRVIEAQGEWNEQTGSRSRRWWNVCGRCGTTGWMRRRLREEIGSCRRSWATPRRRLHSRSAGESPLQRHAREARRRSRGSKATGTEEETALMKVAVVTAAMRSGERGGAEAFYAGLVGGLRSIGVEADEVAVRDRRVDLRDGARLV